MPINVSAISVISNAPVSLRRFVFILYYKCVKAGIGCVLPYLFSPDTNIFATLERNFCNYQFGKS